MYLRAIRDPPDLYLTSVLSLSNELRQSNVH
jgi:hypothetical protein